MDTFGIAVSYHESFHDDGWLNPLPGTMIMFVAPVGANGIDRRLRRCKPLRRRHGVRLVRQPEDDLWISLVQLREPPPQVRERAVGNSGGTDDVFLVARKAREFAAVRLDHDVHAFTRRVVHAIAHGGLVGQRKIAVEAGLQDFPREEQAHVSHAFRREVIDILVGHPKVMLTLNRLQSCGRGPLGARQVDAS